jgi:CDP-diacylglycerol---glycerol-3-phosphate 3-phosphatidyltransferase
MLALIEKKLKIRKLFDKFTFKINPNIISVLALIAAVVAGYLFYANRFVLAGLFVLLNGFFDLLDGQIAKKYNLTTDFGDFIDHTFDRLSDVAIFVGIAISGVVPKEVGFATVIVVLLVSYLGTQAQAISKKRLYAGIMGRADRLMLLFLASLLTVVYTNALYYIIWIILGLSVLTFIQRFILSKKIICDSR